jgi:hypothetical protein
MNRAHRRTCLFISALTISACGGGGESQPPPPDSGASVAPAIDAAIPATDAAPPKADDGGTTADARIAAPSADAAADSAPIDVAAADGPVATGPVDIRGIYLVGAPAAVNDGSLAAALDGPGIDGVLVKVKWSDLAPTLKTYDWTVLDNQARLAVGRRLKFEVAITLGGSAPDWLYAPPPAGLGAGQVNLQYADKGGANARCIPINEARPWDPIYLGAVDDLLAQLARHLEAVGWYGSLSMLRLTAINAWTDELRLPAQTPRTISLPCITDSVQIWAAAGFRPSVLLAGWKQALASYQRYFPEKTFNLAVLAGGSFPPIDDSGTPAAGGTAPAMVAGLVSDLIAAAAQAFPMRLVVQENGLVADAPPDSAVTTAAAADAASFAWQTNEWLGLAGGAACGGSFAAPVDCAVGTYHDMLWNGIHPPGAMGSARYLELFAPNTVAFPVQTRLAHDELLK